MTTDHIEQDIRICQEELKSDSPAGNSAHTELRGGNISDDLTSSGTSDKTNESGTDNDIAPVQVMMYADDITITSTHTSMSAARKYIQPYLHKVYDWTQHNNLIINPDKTTCTLFTPDSAEYNSNLGLNINNKALPMALHPKVLGLTLDPKLTYNAHIQNIATVIIA